MDYIKPSDAVAKLGLKPEDITDVIISHMHWDHADGMDLFPKAKVWLQKDELEYYAGEAWVNRGGTHGGIDADDVMAAVKLNTQGRMGLGERRCTGSSPGHHGVYRRVLIRTRRNSSPSTRRQAR